MIDLIDDEIVVEKETDVIDEITDDDDIEETEIEEKEIEESEEYINWKKENIEDLRAEFCEENDDFNAYCDEQFNMYKESF